jgi:hypothetical protein
MKFPLEKYCPRIPLSSEIKLEAEPYVYKATIRGLYDTGFIEDYPSFLDLLDPRNVSSLSLSAQVKYGELLETHTCGLHGEIAFDIYRGLDYHVAFEVAKSYVYHDIKVTKTGKLLYPYVYPDACLDVSCSVQGNCLGSKTIDVKARGRPESLKYLGLGIKDTWWLSHVGRYDDFYVAVSELEEHVSHSCDAASKPVYEVIGYAILGFATQREVEAVTPNPLYRNIHYDCLHRIEHLNPRDCETSETVPINW